MHSPFEVYRGAAVVAFPLPTVFKMQVYVGCPLGVVFLVDVDVVAVARNHGFWSAIELDPGVSRDDVVHPEFWIVDHDGECFPAFAALHRNPYLQVMVPIAYIGDFHIFAVELLLDFVFAIDAVFEEPAALDFPAVVDAATGAKACGKACGKGVDAKARCAKMKVHSDKAKKVVPNVILSEASHPGLILSGHVQFIAYVSTMLGTGTGSAYTVLITDALIYILSSIAA